MHPHDTDSTVNIRRVADLAYHRSPEWRARRLALVTFTIGLFAGFTLAGMIAGLVSL